jgi:hypothetical protein
MKPRACSADHVLRRHPSNSRKQPGIGSAGLARSSAERRGPAQPSPPPSIWPAGALRRCGAATPASAAAVSPALRVRHRCRAMPGSASTCRRTIPSIPTSPASFRRPTACSGPRATGRHRQRRRRPAPLAAPRRLAGGLVSAAPRLGREGRGLSQRAERLRLRPGRRRGRPRNSRRPHPRRHHRARPLPLLGRRRARAAPGSSASATSTRASRNCSSAPTSHAARNWPAASPAIPPAPTPGPMPMRRGGLRRQPAAARPDAARADAGARARRQPLGDLGALGNDAALAFGFTQFMRLKEDWLRLNRQLFGHRFMMDRIVPGGVALDLDAPGLSAIVEQCDCDRREVKELRRSTTSTPACRTASSPPASSTQRWRANCR